MPRTTAIGYYHQNLVGLAQRLTDHLATVPADAPRERLWKVRANQVVLAQGALEKPLVFDGNDRPGVMLAGAAQTYLNRYGVKVGDRPAIVTAHDSAWHAAFDLARGRREARRHRRRPPDGRRGPHRPRPRPRHRDPARPHRHRHLRPPAGEVAARQPRRERQGRRSRATSPATRC